MYDLNIFTKKLGSLDFNDFNRAYEILRDFFVTRSMWAAHFKSLVKCIPRSRTDSHLAIHIGDEGTF
jgi:hypothetical protein